jgi:hypothetical protein
MAGGARDRGGGQRKWRRAQVAGGGEVDREAGDACEAGRVRIRARQGDAKRKEKEKKRGGNKK